MEADGAVDAQNAPTVPWKTLCVFHELPQGLSNQITHEKPRKAETTPVTGSVSGFPRPLTPTASRTRFEQDAGRTARDQC